MMAAAAAAIVEEISAAKKLWSRSWKEAVFVAYTPFVVCLASGNLELDVFRRFIAQDLHFLPAIAKAYEMMTEFADDDEDIVAILHMRKSILEELSLHVSVMKIQYSIEAECLRIALKVDWGVDPEQVFVPQPATVKYTDFLLATAQGKFEGGKSGKIVTPFEKTKIPAYAVGAMTPCVRLYYHLGKEMKSLLPHHDDHFYKKWISSYSSKDFEAAAVKVEELLDKLSVSLTGEEFDFVEKLYQQAMKLEIEFFSAQPITQATVVPFMKLHDPSKRLFVFCDFDLTCTVIDSSTILAEIAILTASKADQKTDPSMVNTQKTSLDMRKSWEALSLQYIEEYEKCIANLLPNEVKEFDYSGLYKSLEELAKFEKHANLRINESGLLSGMNLDDIRRAGEHLKFHDGCPEFFQKIVKKKDTMSVEFHMLSYCWCADFIRAAFSAVGCLNDLNIHSNEFNFDDCGVSTGEIVVKIESPLDKVEAFTNIINEQSNESQLSVYIGDSVGDLLCLLKADVGIVFGSSEILRKVAKQFGVSLIPLYSGLVMKQRHLVVDEDNNNTMWRGLSGVLYTAASWTEIQAFLLGA